MLVGVPKEIKDHEYRVALTPSTVRELVSKGHRVLAQSGAGHGAGISDDDYMAAGAELVAGAGEVFDRAELIVKVKEPLAQERKKLKGGQILFTYLHLAADLCQTEELMASGVSAIAYETVTSAQGTLPLLVPMSQVAGRMAPQVGAHVRTQRSWLSAGGGTTCEAHDSSTESARLGRNANACFLPFEIPMGPHSCRQSRNKKMRGSTLIAMN
jgi:alanine dehydrogenase